MTRKNYKPVLLMNMDAKIPQQDTRKTNLETYKNNYTLWPKETYPQCKLDLTSPNQEFPKHNENYYENPPWTLCAVLCLASQSCLTLCNCIDCSLPGSSVHRDSPGKNTGVGCHAFLRGIFLTQGLNSGLPHCRQILYHLSHQGSPRILKRAAYPFSRGSFWPRYRTGVSCIAGGFFTSWPTREAPCWHYT